MSTLEGSKASLQGRDKYDVKHTERIVRAVDHNRPAFRAKRYVVRMGDFDDFAISQAQAERMEWLMMSCFLDGIDGHTASFLA